MASNIRTVSAIRLIIVSILLWHSGCGKMAGPSGTDLRPVQETIRKEIGLKKDSSYSSKETLKLKKRIDELVRDGSKSALFDKALLYFLDHDIYKMFKGLKEYHDVTGDDTRIFFYALHGGYIDEPFWSGIRYYNDLVTRESAYARYELGEFDPRLSPHAPEREKLSHINPANWKSYKTLSGFISGIKKHEKPDVASVKTFYKEMNEKSAIESLILSLTYMMRFSEAYLVFDSHRKQFNRESVKDMLAVSPALYYAEHYDEFVEWYSYDQTFDERNLMLVASLLKLGRVDESIKVLSGLIDHAILKIHMLRQPNENRDEPAFFNLLFFYYFAGLYEDFKLAGKTAEIDSMFERRYYSFSELDRERHRAFRFQLRNPIE